MRIVSIIVCHLSKRWKAKFFIPGDIIFLVRPYVKLITLGSERVKPINPGLSQTYFPSNWILNMKRIRHQNVCIATSRPEQKALTCFHNLFFCNLFSVRSCGKKVPGWELGWPPEEPTADISRPTLWPGMIRLGTSTVNWQAKWVTCYRYVTQWCAMGKDHQGNVITSAMVESPQPWCKQLSPGLRELPEVVPNPSTLRKVAKRLGSEITSSLNNVQIGKASM